MTFEIGNFHDISAIYQFPSIILPGVSGWRLEYAEYQNMLEIAEYHSKENASNVSIDKVSVMSFLIFLLKFFWCQCNGHSQMTTFL